MPDSRLSYPAAPGSIARVHLGEVPREAKVLRNSFFRWCTLSLKGHLIFFQLLGATPLSLWAILTMQSEGTLTLGRAVRMTLLCSVLVAIGATLLWYAFSKPLIKS